MVSGAAAVVGPRVLGGLLTEAAGYRWIFYFDIPIGLAAGTASVRVPANDRPEHGAGQVGVGRPGGVVAPPWTASGGPGSG
jgi:hypothetical protein